MVKIPLAKNRPAIDHRTPQKDRDVSRKAHPEAGVYRQPVLGAGLLTWSSGLAPAYPHTPPPPVESAPVAHLKPGHLYFCWPLASTFSLGFFD